MVTLNTLTVNAISISLEADEAANAVAFWGLDYYDCVVYFSRVVYSA
jgi:hypothetical protein